MVFTGVPFPSHHKCSSYSSSLSLRPSRFFFSLSLLFSLLPNMPWVLSELVCPQGWPLMPRVHWSLIWNLFSLIFEIPEQGWPPADVKQREIWAMNLYLVLHFSSLDTLPGLGEAAEWGARRAGVQAGISQRGRGLRLTPSYCKLSLPVPHISQSINQIEQLLLSVSLRPTVRDI